MSSLLDSLDSQIEPPLEPPPKQNDEELDLMKLEEKRESLTLWRRPMCTLNYFVKELGLVSSELIARLLGFWKTILSTILASLLLILALHVMSPRQGLFQGVYKEIKWCLYWLGLGVLSSVGLGTGLHTFLLYLGPHIASVTLAAYECDSLDFPEPPYPNQIRCPEEETFESLERSSSVSFWGIMQKVMVESIMWGAGTALGELPPYLMARTARLSGDDSEETDDLKELEELEIKNKQDPNSMTFFEKIKLSMEQIVQRVGFFGILACASIPNPLFDLVGIICGHFLIPFWTFFGATLLGRAIIKMMIQVSIIIIMFNEILIEATSNYLSYVPMVGDQLRAPLVDLLLTQKRKLHERDVSESSSSKLSMIFELVVPAMVIYFILSIINLMAQRYQKRLEKQNNKRKAKTE